VVQRPVRDGVAVIEPPASSAALEVTEQDPAAPTLVELVLRPDTFFARPTSKWRWRSKLIAAALMGLSAGVDRADITTISARGLEGWEQYWFVVIGTALIVGPIRWFLGGFWFRTRLRLSGARKVDRVRAQNLFALSDLVQAVPSVGLAVLSVLTLSTPEDSPFWWAVLMALVWSVVVSYRGVRGGFSVSVWKARFWFLLVPALFFGWFIGRTAAPGWRALWQPFVSSVSGG
jgi:hypothetical protein